MPEIICNKDTCIHRSDYGKCAKEGTVEFTDGGQGSEDTDEYLICESYSGGR